MDIKAESVSKLNGSIPIQDYENAIIKTDRFDQTDIVPILLGLYGEVGSIMAATKKYRREKLAYPGYQLEVEEEFGDAFWYFAALSRRCNLGLTELLGYVTHNATETIISASDLESAPISKMYRVPTTETIDTALIDLGYMAAQLLKIKKDSPESKDKLTEFLSIYFQAIQSLKLSFATIIKGNLAKTLGRFSIPELTSLPDFDFSFPEEEQLPRKFEIHITQRKSGQSYLRWNGVFIGSPLTDNIKKPDGYRFHDVFHFAYAAILHWSPTFRALIKHKRKSDPIFDEAQDSGRAIVVEEGLSAWIYSYSKGLNYFEGHNSVSFDVLKTIQKFVQGYEVEQCPLKLWEEAILKGFEVFREVKRNNGGIVLGDRENRTISYQPLEEYQ